MNYPDEKQVIEDLKKLRGGNSQITLTINPSTVWVLVVLIQIALRHYLFFKELADEIRKIAKDMQASLDGRPLYTECLKQVLDLGWDTNSDNSVEEHSNRVQRRNNN